MFQSEVFRFFSVVCVCGGLVGAAQLLPPLTAPSEPLEFTPGSRKAANFDPMGYCQNNLSGVNCGCFAQKAAQILSEDNAQVTGYVYADPIDLAISQGGAGCS